MASFLLDEVDIHHPLRLNSEHAQISQLALSYMCHSHDSYLPSNLNDLKSTSNVKLSLSNAPPSLQNHKGN